MGSGGEVPIGTSFPTKWIVSAERIQTIVLRVSILMKGQAPRHH
jgi:hypothetical protein